MSLKVDLKSQELRRGVSFDYGWIFVFIFVLVAFVVFYLAGLHLQNVVDQKKVELQQWQDKVAGFSGIQGKLDQLKGDIVSIQAQITQMRELRYDPLRYSILLVRLSKLLPPNLWLSSLSIEPARNQISMAGSAIQQAGHPPLASIAELLRNLQNDKDNYFSDVALQGTSSSGKTGSIWTFTLQANYNVPLIRSGTGAAVPLPGAAPVTPAPPAAPQAGSPAAPQSAPTAAPSQAAPGSGSPVPAASPTPAPQATPSAAPPPGKGSSNPQ